MTLQIEPLTKKHSRSDFDCGDEDVTRFLREQALQDQERNLSRTMVLIEPRLSPTKIIGFHTLVMAQVRQAEIPKDRPRIKRGIPVILLGQIGVDVGFHGKGWGDLLLMDVQARTAEISEKVGIRALMLDARSDVLASWYEKHDFVRLPGSFRMFKNIDAIRRLDLVLKSEA